VDPDKRDIVETGVLTGVGDAFGYEAGSWQVALHMRRHSQLGPLASTTGHHNGLPNPLRRSDLRGR
jgi:hypothetical protein